MRRAQYKLIMHNIDFTKLCIGAGNNSAPPLKRKEL